MPGNRRSTTPFVLVAMTLAILVVTAGCSLFDRYPETLPDPAEVDVVYGPAPWCDPEDLNCPSSQTIDIYRSEVEGPNPVLLWIHGGGFVVGDKGPVPGALQEALDAGWDVVSLNYRLAREDGVNQFPTAVHDAKLAVRWIRANAADQGWDPDSIAAIGHSAGGNIVGLLATTAGDPFFEPMAPPGFEQLNGVDSSILAGIAVAPVSDLRRFATVDKGALETVTRYLNCKGNCDDKVARGSVQTHVDGSAAPLLTVHGVDDVLAPPIHGELVERAYDAAGVADRYQTITVDDGPEEHRGHDVDFGRFAKEFVAFLDQARADAGLVPAN